MSNLVGMSRRAGRVALTSLAAIALIALAAPTASAHGGTKPVARDPLTGGPIVTLRQLAQIRQRTHAERVGLLRQQAAHLPIAAATPASAILGSPSPGSPQNTRWSGTLTYAPEALIFPPFDGSDPCLEPSEGALPECEEFALTVPGGAKALYAKVTWQRADYALYLFAFDPDYDFDLPPDDEDQPGKQYGLDWSRTDNEIDKRPGNSTTLPISEVSVADPKPGAWKIRVRAAWGLNVAYSALAAVTSEPLIRWPREDNLQLARWATHRIPVNVVLVGIEPSKDQIKEARSLLPAQYRTTVLIKQGVDGGPGDEDLEDCSGGNWTRCHFRGTYSDEEREDDGNVPYFEPVKFEYDYHFIQADEVYTRAAFARMKELTKKDARAQGTFLRQYTLNGGMFRDPVVSPASRVDLIDALKFEDWLFESRFQFPKHFTDLETGEVHGGGFISPDPGAYYDPYYDLHGRNIDRMPQGRNQGVTFFFFDTYSPSYAGEYFDMSKYHNFSTMDAFEDPDTSDTTLLDYARLWGGRFRFAFLDLGAAPNSREASSIAGVGGGSADYPLGDPPIWEYRNNPLWQPRFVSQGLVRNVATLLFARMTAGYLYRPIPHDIYQLTTTNFVDHYSTSASGYGTLNPDLTKLYKEDLAARWLSAAIPHTTFRGTNRIPDFVTYRHLKCSDEHVGSKSAITETALMAPDPTCLGSEPDLLQRAVERAKAQGDDIFGAGIPFEQAVSASLIRNYWEANRSAYAPVADGLYSMVLINAVFEKLYTWALPVVVGGIAFFTPHEESWGNFQNLNEGTENPVFPYGGGFTYFVEHEASHSLGLLHPHDSVGVDKDANGKWNYYYDTFVWLPDMTQSPTTYLGVIYPYGVWDQDNLMRGHVAEYIQSAQDAIADAYFEAGRRGIGGIDQAPEVVARGKLMTSYLEKGRSLFANGDYLHAEYAFRNAHLAAAGHTGPDVEPRELRPGDKVFFKINPQNGPSRAQAVVLGEQIKRPALAATGASPLRPLLAWGLILAAAAMARWLRRPPALR